jgi:hypothetical protein
MLPIAIPKSESSVRAAACEYKGVRIGRGKERALGKGIICASIRVKEDGAKDWHNIYVHICDSNVKLFYVEINFFLCFI